MSELDSEVTPTVQTLSMVKKHKIGVFLHDGTKYLIDGWLIGINRRRTGSDYVQRIRRLRDDFPVFL